MLGYNKQSPKWEALLVLFKDRYLLVTWCYGTSFEFIATKDAVVDEEGDTDLDSTPKGMNDQIMNDVIFAPCFIKDF